MENHWLKNIEIRLYTANLLETQFFYSSVLNLHGIIGSSTQLIISIDTIRFIFTTNQENAVSSTNHLSFETNQIDKLWENVKHRAKILKPIADTGDGEFRTFTMLDNNNYVLQFFERNNSHQLSLDLYNH